MKILLHSDMKKTIQQSGVGRAQLHQEMALNSAGIAYTTNYKDDFDIVHINTVFPHSLLVAKKAKSAGKPVIYHAHSTMEDFRNSYTFSNQASLGFKYWLNTCYNSADLILTPSQYAKDLLEKYDIDKPIHVISNGIDLSYWQATAEEVAQMRSRFNLKADQKVAISVGLQIERKGIIEFVELAKQMPEVTFIWFGYSNPYALPKEVKKAIATRLPNLIFAGYIPRDQVRVAYQMADVYLFMTHEETEGIVLLEALASKVDTVVSDLPVFDYLNANQDVYKADSLSAFKERLQGLLDGNLPSLSESGYQQASLKSIQNIGQQYIYEYQYASACHVETNKDKKLSKIFFSTFKI